MKFLPSRFKGKPDARSDDAPDSRPPSRFRDSLFAKSRVHEEDAEAALAAAEAQHRAAKSREQAEKYELRKELLRVVLAKTIQKTNVPSAWISGELNSMVTESGEDWIEVRLSVEVDEPRLFTYLTSFQAELERRLLAAAPDVKEWLAGIAWKLTPDAIYELPMPQAEYWEHVQADRLLTARQKGAEEWDRESLERHFSDTNPGDLVVDFVDTNPPERHVEDIAPPPAEQKKP